MNLQVAGFLEHSTVNGEGLRSVVFVSGCSHACPGCQNEAMQDPGFGDSIPLSVIYERIMKNKPIIDGVTFSGGEPFDQCPLLAELAKQLKAQGLNIWCYSGYTYSELKQDPHKRVLLDLVDVLVDGPFIASSSSEHLKYRGSSNQHIYALQQGEITRCLDQYFI